MRDAPVLRGDPALDSCRLIAAGYAPEYSIHPASIPPSPPPPLPPSPLSPPPARRFNDGDDEGRAQIFRQLLAGVALVYRAVSNPFGDRGGGEGGVGAALLSPRGRPVRGLRGASRFAAVCVRTPGLDGRLSRDAPKASGWFRDEVTDR